MEAARTVKGSKINCSIENGKKVSGELCSTYSASFTKHKVFCLDCKSHHKVCLVCVEQRELQSGFSTEFLVTRRSGFKLCLFHTQNGHESSRNGNGNKKSAGEKRTVEDMLEEAKGELPKLEREMLLTKPEVAKDSFVRDTSELTEDEKPELLKHVQAMAIPVKRIIPMKDQPREYFDIAALKSLAASMQGGKQRTLIVVVDRGDGWYDLIDGERRWRSAKTNNDKRINALVCSKGVFRNAEERFIESAVANIFREGHTPIEMAKTIKRIMEYKDYSVEQMVSIVGQEKATIYNLLNLLKLDASVVEMMHPRNDFPLQATVAYRLGEIHSSVHVPLARKIVAKRMKTNQATLFIRKELDRLGQHKRKKDRPSSNRRLFRSFIARVERDAARFLDMNSVEFDAMFKNILTKEHSAIQREFEEMQKTIQKVRTRF